MNRSDNFGPARPCGHRKYEWDCKVCLAAYNRKQAARRAQESPVYRELAILPWRVVG